MRRYLAGLSELPCWRVIGHVFLATLALPGVALAVPPETTILAGTYDDFDEVTSSTSITFYFYASDQSVNFDCKLDNTAWQPCSTPKHYTGLAAGSHVFQVAAKDNLGNRDASPATRNWTVQLTPPATSITSGPVGIAVSPNARFDISGGGSGYECRLDKGGWEACSSPRTYASLPSGPHRLQVRTIDNRLPATRRWTSAVQRSGPVTAPVLSQKGRYIAYESSASDLVPDDTNGTTDVFLEDRATLQVRRVSLSLSGAQLSGPSANPSISADGRYVAFDTLTFNTDPDGNRVRRIYIFDRVTATTKDVTGPDGWDSSDPDISATGNAVAFVKRIGRACDSGCVAYNNYIYRFWPATGALIWVDPYSTYDINHNSFAPSISNAGRYVAFASTSKYLIAGDTNNAQDVFRRDVTYASTARVSVNASNVQGNGSSGAPSISGDGQRVAFDSTATNLGCCVADTNAGRDIIHKNLGTGSSINLTVYANKSKWAPALADNGRVSFVTDSTTMDTYDTNGVLDVYDGFVGTSANSYGCCVRLSYDYAQYEQLNAASASPGISPDGRYTAFTTDATNLVAYPDEDVNGVTDIAVHVFRDDYSHCLRVDASSAGAPASAAAGLFAAYGAAGYSEDAAYESTLSAIHNQTVEQRCRDEADTFASVAATIAELACKKSGRSDAECRQEAVDAYRETFEDRYGECLKREFGLPP